MPGSSRIGRPIIKDWFEKQSDIKTIVDLGPGQGTYPKLLGIDKYIWKAVEIWGPYIKQFDLDKIYREIRVGDIRYMELPDGDCCIAGDVLEHLKKDDAIFTFKKINAQFRHVVLSIPINMHMGISWNNPFEIHRSLWQYEELDKLIGPEYKIRKHIKFMSVFIK